MSILHTVKNYLDDKKIKYEYVDVSKDQKRAQEMVEKTGQMGVPVTIITKGDQDEVIVGFDKGRIDKIITK
ncbi:MAG: glutaredoxin family protein [Candidatus Helarchaeota archaeon]